MTAVAAVRVAGTPVLVGDVVLTYKGERIAHAGKVYEVSRNIALGWSGRASAAAEVLKRLAVFRGQDVPLEVLNAALDGLEDLRGPVDEKPELDLIGWIVTAAGPKVVRWATWYPPSRFGESEGYVGDGGERLKAMLAEPDIGAGNSQGYDEAPMKLITGFSEALFEEVLRPNKWPTTWGAAYEAMVYQEGTFKWMPKLTYVGWDLHLDDRDRIVDVHQAPVVWTQERVHRCTVFYKSEVRRVSEPQVSFPVDADALDLDMYKRRPHKVVSPYYANYFRLFAPNFFVIMPYTACNATPAGPMFHDGADETEPLFQVNRERLQPMIDRVLRDIRARPDLIAQPA